MNVGQYVSDLPLAKVVIREPSGSYGEKRVDRRGYAPLLSHTDTVRDMLRSFRSEDWVQEICQWRWLRDDRALAASGVWHRGEAAVYRLESKGRTELYIMIVLQSKSDPRLPFRLLQSAAELWEADVRHAEDDGDALLPLPAIVPVVVCIGRHPWNAALSLRETIRGQARFPARLLPDIGWVILDAARYGKQELLEKQSLMAGVFLIEQSRSVDEIVGHLRLLLPTLRRWDDAKRRLFRRWVSDVVGGTLQEEPELPDDSSSHEQPEEEWPLISNVERVLKHAYLKQRMQGYAEGVADGQAEARRDVARKMLEHGMSLARIGAVTGLSEAEIEQLMIH